MSALIIRINNKKPQGKNIEAFEYWEDGPGIPEIVDPENPDEPKDTGPKEEERKKEVN